MLIIQQEESFGNGVQHFWTIIINIEEEDFVREIRSGRGRIPVHDLPPVDDGYLTVCRNRETADQTECSRTE